MSMDQSFHTPSFGDEEFEIPPLSYASTGSASRAVNASGVFGNSMPVEYFKGRLIGGQTYVFAPGLNYNNLGRNYHQSHPQQQSQNSGSNHPSCQQPHVNNNLLPPASPQGAMMDNSQAPYQSPPQSAGAGAMSPHQDVYRRSAEMMSPHSVHMQVQSYDNNGTYSNAAVHQQGTVQALQMNMMSQAPHMSPMGPPQQQTMFSTISQSQLSSHLGLQIGMGSNTHQGPGSVGSPPPGSNHNSPALETSEDSDDSTPLAHLIGGMKRPSPEPVDISQPKTPKKPKAQKKKKKRDPNEPQKPVSAYALFFRDTQAAIKGQNPNASFGEVSKIVASMWDSLDIETKNNYKKKTETAKKEYLKALAAYRATLVSKAAVDHSDAMYVTNAMSCGSPPASHSASNSPPGHMMSPIQKKSPVLASVIDTMQHVTSSMANQQPSCSHLSSAGKTWCIQQIPPPQQQQQQQSPPHHQQQHMMGNSPPHMMHGNQMVPVHAQQMPQLSPSQNQMNIMGNSPQVTQISTVPTQINHSNSNSPSYPQNMSPASMGGTHQNVSGGDILPPLQNCLRSGCPNPAIDSPDWDREYCSSECVVSHCRDVFTQWVASRQASGTYASVK